MGRRCCKQGIGLPGGISGYLERPSRKSIGGQQRIQFKAQSRFSKSDESCNGSLYLVRQSSNRKKAAGIIGKTPYVNAPADVIEVRLMGDYNLGCNQGTEVYDSYMLFTKAERLIFLVNLCYLGNGAVCTFWLFKEAPEYKELQTNSSCKICTRSRDKHENKDSNNDMKPFSLTMDKTVFDPSNPEAYLKVVRK